MSPIRLLATFGLLLVASAAAQAASPATAAQAPMLGGALLSLELDLSAVNDAAAADHAQPARPSLRGAAARNPSRASYSRLLPQPIEDRGLGYRLWF